MNFRYTTGIKFVWIALSSALMGCGSDTTSAQDAGGTNDATQDTGATVDTGTAGETGSPESGGGDDGGGVAEAAADTGSVTGEGGDGGGPSAEDGGAEGGGPSAEGGADAAVALNCASYCQLIKQNCTAANQQYASDSECMNACALFTPGALADTAGATLGCRIYHAGLAAGQANPHCWHAGPYGFDACGSQCDNFCTLALGWCSASGGFDGGAPPYMNSGLCRSSCMGLALGDGGALPSTYSAAGPASGNTLDCREWHLGKALVDHTAAGQQLHCNHVGATSPTCM